MAARAIPSLCGIPFAPGRLSEPVLLLLLALSCADPLPLPSAVAVEKLDRSTLPPLYRQLYDYAFLPKVQLKEQRVRILVWLSEMGLDRYQLGLMKELWERTDRERKAVEQKQREIIESYEPKIGTVYDTLWEQMQAGATEEELGKQAEPLNTLVHSREAELLELRSHSVRALFEAQAALLKTLRPKQEIMMSDAVFFLRHRLDPYANPGDFNALIGTVYVAGEFGALSRPSFDPNEDHLNIGGLWSEDPEKLTGPYFPNARREVILYMVLLEPALPEAIEAALLRKSKEPPEVTAPGTPAAPPPGEPSAPPPGEPSAPPVAPPGEAPPPGQPTEPQPGQP